MLIIQYKLDLQDELFRFRKMAGACMIVEFIIFLVVYMIFIVVSL